MTRPALLLSLLCLAPACADDPADAEPSERGARYCEILLGTADLAAGTVAIDVYNTFGLNDCPQEAWAAVDVAAVQAETGATAVILNGPRYWVLDRIDRGSLLDPEVRALDGLEMRKTGALTLSLAEATGSAAPYTARQVARDTIWAYEAGKQVYELVDADGAVHVMQSYSTQHIAQDEGSLATLGEALALPAGWSFRARVLAEELLVVAEDGVAVVVQDERGNTYQRAR